MVIFFEEESLHSYLLRRLLCVGEFTAEAIVGIVTQSGGMRANPKILESHLCYFRIANLSDSVVSFERDLVTPFLDENTTKSGKYVQLNRAFFHGIPIGNYFCGKTQLRFCSDCMRERIKFDGVAWLEDEWTFEERCHIHNTLMHELRNRKCNCEPHSLGIVDRLRSMFSGICNRCREDIYASQAGSGSDSHKHPDYPKTYSFHDIVYKIDGRWHGIDGEKPYSFEPRL
jgi:hypothetical protein